MNHSSRTSQRGFSLVELMVVVAIIGVLASIAIPSVNKYIAKARQTEAKTSLSSLYTSEKAFYAEYTAYHSAFGAIGYSPEGQLRYNVGFGAAGVVANAANGYTAPTGLDTSKFNSVAYCVASGGTMTAGQSCAMLNGATNQAPPSLNAANTVDTTGNSFTGEAAAVIHSAGATDIWTIDQNKLIKNTNSGIP